jgi:hypothetical protein
MTVTSRATEVEMTMAALRAHPSWQTVLLGARSKKPASEHWTITRDEALLRVHIQRGDNLGLIAHQDTGLAVLDADQMEAWGSMVAALGEPGVPWVRTGSEKLHYYIAWEPDLPAVMLWQGTKVGEVFRGAPTGQVKQQQVVLPGSLHPETAGLYRWLVDPSVEPLSPLPEAWRQHFRSSSPTRPTGPRPADDDRLLLAALQQPGAVRRQDRVKFQCPACQADGHDAHRDNAAYFLDSRRWGCAWAKDTPAALAHGHAIGAALGATATDDAPAPLTVHTWNELMRRAPIPLVYQWPGWLVQGKSYFVAGAGDSTKSFLCFYLACMIAAGRQALGATTPCAQGSALIISAENGIDEDHRRAHLLRRGLDLPDELPLALLSADAISLKDKETWAHILERVEAERPRVVVIDSAIAVAELENENDNAEVMAFMKTRVNPLARIYGATVLLIGHSPKIPVQKGLVFTDEHVARGASAWRNAVDGMLYLRRDKTLGPRAIVLRPAKVRVGRRPAALWFSIEDTETDDRGEALGVQLRYGGTVDEVQQAEADLLGKAVEAALDLVKGRTRYGVGELAQALRDLKIAKATAARAISVLRGKVPWPLGQHAGKQVAIVRVDRDGKRIFLTLENDSQGELVKESDEHYQDDDDEPPF